MCVCVCSAEAGQSALESEAKSNEIGGIERKSTRTWAMSTGYDPQKLFNKVIHLPLFYFLFCLRVGFLFVCLLFCAFFLLLMTGLDVRCVSHVKHVPTQPFLSILWLFGLVQAKYSMVEYTNLSPCPIG